MSGYTQEQLTALKQALARGVRTVSYDGQTVTYQSADDMRKTIAAIERELAGRSPLAPRFVTLATDRGFR